MTISDTSRRAGPYDGNDVATSFAFDFKTLSSSHLRVVWFDGTAEYDLVLDSDYSVTLNGDQDADPGGSVTYPLSGAPLATGERLAIISDLPLDQPLDLTNGGAFNAQTLENELDRIVMQIQQLLEVAERTAAGGVTSPATYALPLPVAEYVLGWNADADALINYPRTSTGLTGPDGSVVIEPIYSGTYGGVLRLHNTIDDTYVDLFCLSDGTFGLLDKNGNGYVRLYNTTFAGRVSLRCDTDGAFSLVSDDDNEMFQVYQDGTTQTQGPLEKTVSGTTYTLLAADRGKLLNFTNAAGCAVTIPADFLTGVLASSVFYWRQAGAAQVTFAGAGGVTLRNKDSHTKSEKLYAMGMLHQMADVNTWNLVGATGA